MAASDYNFNLTRTEIVDRAFRIIGILAPGQSMGGDEQEQGRIALNAMVARWQSDHIFLWAQDAITLPLVNATQSYALQNDPQILTVDQAYIRINSNDRPLEIIGWDDFQEFYNKASTGDPAYIAIDYTATGGTLWTWPTIGTASGKTLLLFCTVELQDFDLSNANPDARSCWLDALSYGLADQLSDEYSLSISERQVISQKAAIFYKTAKKTDVRRPEFYCAKGAY